MYPGSFERFVHQNPKHVSFNAGFMGIRLEIYDDFLEKEDFIELLDLFNFNGILDENGKEILGAKRTIIDTQQQSFFSVMNQLTTMEPQMIPPSNYFIQPNFGKHPEYGKIDPEDGYEGWSINMKSKIMHFIGHSFINGKYYGKPKVFNDLVDKYLKENNLIRQK